MSKSISYAESFVKEDFVRKEEFDKGIKTAVNEIEQIMLTGGDEINKGVKETVAALEELIKESYEIENRIFDTNREIRIIKERLDIAICHHDSRFKLIEKLVRAVWITGGAITALLTLNIFIG
jgi:hypothetical protein